MSEENKEPVSENPKPESAAAKAPQEVPAVPPASPAEQAPVEGPKRILQELEKAAADPHAAPSPAELAAAAPEPASAVPAAETSAASDPAEVPAASTAPESAAPSAEAAPATETQPSTTGMPLITDAMRRLDELLSRFR